MSTPERRTGPGGPVHGVAGEAIDNSNDSATLRLPIALAMRLQRIERDVEALAVCVVACRGEGCTTRCWAVTQ